MPKFITVRCVLDSISGRDEFGDFAMGKGGTYETHFKRGMSLIKSGHCELVKEGTGNKPMAKLEVETKLKFHELKKWLTDKGIPVLKTDKTKDLRLKYDNANK